MYFESRQVAGHSWEKRKSFISINQLSDHSHISCDQGLFWLCPRGCCAPVSLVRVYPVTLSLHDLVYLFLQGRSSKELSKGISVWWPVAVSSHHFPRPAMKEQVVFNIFTTFLLIRRIAFFTGMFGVCYWIMFLLLNETACLLYLRELPTEFINHLHFLKIKILSGPHDICEKQCLWLNSKGSSPRNAKDII